MVNNVSTFGDHLAELWLGGRERYGTTRNEYTQDGSTFTGFKTYKWILDQDQMAGKDCQWPYLRYAEILLSYAEALNEAGRGSEAYRYINEVRARVNLGALQTGLSKEQLREEILRERACEFGGEEVRFFDMVRWKKEKEFRQRLHGVNIRRPLVNPSSGEFSYEVFTIKKRYWQDDDETGRVTWTPKWYLSPFPFSEMNKGYLTQNPGW